MWGTQRSMLAYNGKEECKGTLFLASYYQEEESAGVHSFLPVKQGQKSAGVHSFLPLNEQGGRVQGYTLSFQY